MTTGFTPYSPDATAPAGSTTFVVAHETAELSLGAAIVADGSKVVGGSGRAAADVNIATQRVGRAVSATRAK